MSDLGYLQRLLDGAAVAWVPLGDPKVGVFIRGGGLQKKDLVEQGVPCIHYGQIYTHYSTFANRTKSFVSQDFARTARKAKTGDLVIATTSENDEDVCKAVAWLGVEDVAVSSDACFYTHNLNPKYVSYFFQTESFQKQKRAFITGTKVRRVNADDLAKIQIPIPCPEDPQKSLAIQGEIVRILDAFTALTAELTAELTARKTQYNHYRNQLLSFEGGEVVHLALGEPRLGVFTRGGGLQKKDFVDRGVPCIHYGQIYTHYGIFADKTKSFVTEDFAKKARKAKPGDLVIATTSENDDDVCKAVAWLGAEDVAVSSDACFYTHNLNPKYVSYFFQTEQFQKQKRVHITGTKVRRVNADDLAKILIPIPFPNDPEKSLAEQARIVAILDNFNTLTTSLAEGLPREIALRKRQYEHYRDLLLSFPKGAVA